MTQKTASLLGQFFVGRKEAFEAFDKFLNDPSKRVFLILGEGGIGKSWLLWRLTEYAQKHRELLVTDEVIDLLSTRYHRISELWDTIARLSGKYDAFETYRREYADLQALRAKEEGFPLAERALQDKSAKVHQLFAQDYKDAFGEHVGLFWFDTFEAVRYDPVGRWLIEELPHSVHNIRLVIAGRPPKQGQPLLPAGESKLVQPYRLGAFEPGDIQELYWTRFGFEPSGAAEEIPRSAEIPLDFAMWELLCGKLEYNPLAIDLAILWVNSDITSYEELNRLLSVEIMNTVFLYLRDVGEVSGLISPERLSDFAIGDLRSIKVAAYQAVLWMAFLDRRFNEYFLERIYTEIPGLPNLEHARLALRQLAEVPSIFFVKEREGGLETEKGYLQLHDVVRDWVLQVLWPVEDDPMRQGRPAKLLGEEREELARKALEIYDELVTSAADNWEREELQVEKLSYSLKLNLDEGYEQFRESYQRNFRNQEWGICQLLLNEITPYESQLGLARHEDLKEFRFQLALVQRYFEVADDLIETDQNRVDYLLTRHIDYAHTNLDEAKTCALEALPICQKQGLVSRRARTELALGFVCKALGQLEEATNWYERLEQTTRTLGGKEGASLYAYALNNGGYIWALIGVYDRAVDAVKGALKIRRIYNWEFEAAQSLSTLGEIARFQGYFDDAEHSYEEAINIFQKLHAYDWEAIVWHQRAENARRIAQQAAQRDSPDQEQVDKYMDFAAKNIGKSLDLFERYRLSRERHKAWRRKGLICYDQGQLEEAAEWLGRAFDLAMERNDSQEALESLTCLASVYIRQKRYQVAHDTLLRVEQCRGAYHFEVFLGLRDVRMAEIYLAQGDIEGALHSYADGLSKLAHHRGYGHARLNPEIDKMADILNRLPTNKDRGRWSQVLLDRYEKEFIEDVFPRLPQVIKQHLHTLSFSAEGESDALGATD